MLKRLKDKIQDFQTILAKFPEVRYAGDPILRQVAEEVSLREGVKIGERLGDVLLRYRKEVGYGRGLAAPQIGEAKAVFVTFEDEKLHTFINPRIVEHSAETNLYREGCLSAGIMAADVERPEWVVIEWTDINGEMQTKKVDGFLARLYQHEEAHLRGKLNLDEAVEDSIEFFLFDPLKEKLRKTRRKLAA